MGSLLSHLISANAGGDFSVEDLITSLLSVEDIDSEFMTMAYALSHLYSPPTKQPLDITLSLPFHPVTVVLYFTVSISFLSLCFILHAKESLCTCIVL